MACAEILQSHFEIIYLSKAILKLHLDRKLQLQITLVYYPYYKRDFGFCQTLWLVMP